MHGKPIVGTTEAFSGYEKVASQVGWICNTKAEFVSTMRRLAATSLPRFDPSLRAIYENTTPTRRRCPDFPEFWALRWRSLGRVGAGETCPVRPPAGTKNAIMPQVPDERASGSDPNGLNRASLKPWSGSGS